MRGKSQFRNSILCIIALTAAVVLLAAVPAWAQNPVPPTAREAAASPAFAAKLHPATRPAMNKPQAAARARTGRPSPQDQVIYENGPVNGTTDAWTINFGYIVSDTFVPSDGSVTGFDLYVWEFPGDIMTSVQWSITDAPNGGNVYGSGTVSGSNLTDMFISTNQFGYDIDKISAAGLNVNLISGSTYWVNLFNATAPSGDPVFWDENSGKGCNSQGCPSQAYESAVGTIPSEAFDITGGCDSLPCFQAGGNLQVLHDFSGKEDGGNPSGVVADMAGNVYGAVSGGGAGFGLVYEIASKSGGWVFNILYNFTGGPNGSSPGTPTVGPAGVLYGTAGGGIQNCSGGYCGLIYSLKPAPTPCLTSLCPWTESVLYQPTGNNDAYDPGNLVFDPAGNLYGTSGSGGAYAKGAIFELTPSGGGWTETILYSFTGGNDGDSPNSVVVGIDGNLYGAASGGVYSSGVVFQLVPSGGSWTENVIYSFGDESWPGSLIQDSFGNLYGVAIGGGPDVEVFMLSPSHGGWVFGVTFSVYIQFDNHWTNSDLAADAAGDLYWAGGATDYASGFGGSPKDYVLFGGVAMRLPIGQWFTLWNSLGQYTFQPGGSLGLDAKRNVYGTTAGCGKYGQGTVWKVTH